MNVMLQCLLSCMVHLAIVLSLQSIASHATSGQSKSSLCLLDSCTQRKQSLDTALQQLFLTLYVITQMLYFSQLRPGKLLICDLAMQGPGIPLQAIDRLLYSCWQVQCFRNPRHRGLGGFLICCLSTAACVSTTFSPDQEVRIQTWQMHCT